MSKVFWLQVRSSVSEDSFEIGEYSSLKEAKKAWFRILKSSKLPLKDCHIMTLDAYGPVSADYYRTDGDYSNCSNMGE